MTANIDTLGLDPDDVANPCGILPFYFPMDSPESVESVATGELIPISNIGLFKGEAKFRFKKDVSKQWMNVAQSRFSNWMKISSTYGATKLWGVSEASIPAGSYLINIFTSSGRISKGEDRTLWIVSDSSHITSKNYLVLVLLGIKCVVFLVFTILLIKKFVSRKVVVRKN